MRLSDKLTLRNVLFVPNLNCTLLSVAKLLKQTDCLAVFTDTLCMLQDRFTRTLIGAREERGGVYVYRDVTLARGHRVKAAEDKTLWHRRLGHPAFGVLGHLPFVSGVLDNKENFGGCDICFKSKQTRGVFSESFNKASVAFELIHVDLWGPYREPSSCGAVYFLTIVDDYSRAVWIHLLLEKSEVKTILPNFCALVQRQFRKSVQKVRSNNGTEFMCLSKYFSANGIIHQTSCVSTPQQNGRVERKHRHILNVSRSLIFQANLPIKFWGECVLAAAHVINRTPSSLLHRKTPYECLYGMSPSYDEIKVFGCLCFAHRASRDKDKFKERIRRCAFVGHPFGKRGWELYDLESHELFVSRDVVFNEDSFPFDMDTYVSSSDPGPSVPHGMGEIYCETPAVELRGSDSDVVIAPEVEPPDESVTETKIKADEAVVTDVSDGSQEEQLGRGHRVSKPSVRLKDYVAYNSQCLDKHNAPLVPPATPSRSSTVQGTSSYPISAYVPDALFSEKHQVFLAAISSEREPRNFKEAMLDPLFREAMSAEVVALEEQRT